MKYFDALKETMEWLARRPETLFLGQTVAGPGTFMHQTLRDLPSEKTLEMPVNESFQMQFSVGLALAGYLPISVYPRQNFLLLAAGDMANLVDKIPTISEGRWNSKVIIRTAVGPDLPLYPGHQHVGNYAQAFRKMFANVEVVELGEPEEILPAYRLAAEREDGRSTLLIEHGNFYAQK